MWKYTVRVDGMMCGMCEAHVNDAIRKNFAVKKVSSSHSKGETVVVSEGEMNEEALREVIEATGYDVKGIERAPYEKKGLLGR